MSDDTPDSTPKRPDDEPDDALGGMNFEDLARGLQEAMSGGTIDPAALSQLQNAGIPVDPAELSSMMNQAMSMFSGSSDGPVNWELARNTARQVCAGSDPSISDEQDDAVADAIRLAQTWLDAHTDIPPSSALPSAWSRAQWVENTMAVWQELVTPVADSMTKAIGEVMKKQAPPEMQGLLGSAEGMMKQLGGAVFGMQLGHAVGTLASEVLGSGDVGLPLADTRVALLPTNVAEFSKDLNVPADEVRLYLALREAAHDRLFHHVPWLRGHIESLVSAYASGITIDTDAMEESMRSVDPSNPEAMQEALSEGVFEIPTSAEQKAQLERLETALALVEGWVDDVVYDSAKDRLPNSDALRETMRRRRASGGPAEHTFASLVGLQLRPRRLRDAATLWRGLAESGGNVARDSLWDHPDLMPATDDLNEPLDFPHKVESRRASSAEFDAALGKLLNEESGGDSTA